MQNFIYGETAFHHEGSFEYMLRMIDLASETGLHGIKFQILIDLNDFVSRYHKNYDQMKSWVFTDKQWNKILIHAFNKNLKIIAMPCDIKAVDYITTAYSKINYCELHSVNFNDIKILNRIKDTNIPTIISCGGRSIDEVIKLCEFFGNQVFTIMHGYQSFPSNLREVKLHRIRILREMFPEFLIGYADHTAYNDEFSVKALEYAYLLGARVFEKHITLNEGIQRVDYESAVGKEKIVKIINNLKIAEDLIANKKLYESLMLTNAEKRYKKREKKLVANQNINIGDALDDSNTSLKMTGDMEGFSNFEEIKGLIAHRRYLPDELIAREEKL